MIQNKVLFIGLVWPEPSSSAAGKRILQLVDFFVQKGDEVMFCSSATKTEASDDLSKWPQLKAVNIRLNDTSFDELLKEFQPDFVVFDRFVTEEQFGWRIHEFSPNAMKILDTEDVHFLRKSREVAYKNGKAIDFDHPMRLREIASILRCDISLIISEVEMNLLIEDCRIDPNLLLYLPFLEEMEVEISQWIYSKERFCVHW